MAPKGTGNAAGGGDPYAGLTPEEVAFVKNAMTQSQTDATHPQTASTTTDPLVYLGPGTIQKGKTHQTTHGTAATADYVPATGDQTGSSSSVYQQFHNLTSDERAKIQQEMFVAGYYGKNANAHDILWGIADPDSLSAWIQVVNQAAFAYSAGQKLTPAQLVAQQALGFGAQGFTTDKHGNRTSVAERAASAAAGPKVSVTSASELAKMARDLGTQLLGRAATQDEQRMVIAAVQRQERAFTGSGGSGERPAPQAIGEDVLRQSAGVEADAHSLADTYSAFLKIIGGSG